MMNYIKPFLTYEGVMKRLEFFLGTFIAIPIAVAILSMIFSAIGVGALASLVSLAGAVIVIFATIQRLRDIGWSPWLTLIMLVPVANAIFYIVIVFKPSKEEAPVE